MSEELLNIRPIGIIHSEHMVPEYAEGLDDLDEFSHIYLLYHLDRAGKARLKVKPFLQNIERGVFATRAPCRPNGIGMSIVRLVRREKNILHIEGVDILDGTPLLDIKPYATRFDCIQTERNGWHDEVEETEAQQRGKRNHQ